MSKKRSCSFEFSEEQVKGYNKSRPSDNIEQVKALIDCGFFANAKEILDIGCGEGRRTAIFAANLPETNILGCDVSKTMIDYALKHYAASNLNFIQMDAEHLDFQKQFDRVISFHCLHWIKNQNKAFEKIFNVLKHGGKALLVASPESQHNDFKAICRRLILSFRWLPYFLTFRPPHSLHTEQEYRQMLSHAWFLIDEVAIKPTDMIFKDKNELDSFLKSILTPLQHLHPRHQPAFLNDFFKELKRKRRVDANGSIHICFDQIEMLVSKK